MTQSNSSVPAEFNDLYQYTQSRLQGFDNTIKAGWNGKNNPGLVIGAEPLPMDNYAQLTQANYYAGNVTPYLNALQSLGAQCVKVKVDFPMLYQPWYAWKYGSTSGPQQYAARLGVYSEFVKDVRARGMKAIIQSVVVPATGGSQSDVLGMSTYYPTLSDSQYTAGRVAQVIAVAELLQPDFLNFSSEPDNEGVKAMRASLEPSDSNWMQNNVALVSAIISGLNGEVAAGRLKGLHTSMKTSIGVGPWTSPFSDFTSLVASYVALDVDIIDVHCHPINLVGTNDYLMNMVTEMDAAAAAGKGVGMDEQWVYYESDTELAANLASETVESRNNWDFWTPLDILYMQVLTDLAHWKNCAYLSFSSSNQFFAKLAYPNTATLSPSQLDAAESASTGTAIQAATLNPTAVGQALSQLIKAGSAQPLGAGVAA